jgi:predicted DNA-binding ribbon-helix-helix protein
LSDQIRKRSVLIAGHATSVSLEVEFWDALKDIATRRQTSLNALVAEIDGGRDGNLSSALRVFVLRELQERAAV